ncbi:hypothetical protein BD560DRAFT_407837 [Blakeslea trispora]|nr:hypothetical protein BD560DRAFT_407837 [Blakeslea trispora]
MTNTFLFNTKGTTVTLFVVRVLVTEVNFSVVAITEVSFFIVLIAITTTSVTIVFFVEL